MAALRGVEVERRRGPALRLEDRPEQERAEPHRTPAACGQRCRSAWPPDRNRSRRNRTRNRHAEPAWEHASARLPECEASARAGQFAAAGRGDMQRRSRTDGELHPPRPRKTREGARAGERRRLLYAQAPRPGAWRIAPRSSARRRSRPCWRRSREDRDPLIAEAADLIYHLLVVLAARGIALAEVEAELAKRTRQSGLEEKASRAHGRKTRSPGSRKSKRRGPASRAREQDDGATHRRRPLALPRVLAGRMGGQARRHADDAWRRTR